MAFEEYISIRGGRNLTKQVFVQESGALYISALCPFFKMVADYVKIYLDIPAKKIKLIPWREDKAAGCIKATKQNSGFSLHMTGVFNRLGIEPSASLEALVEEATEDSLIISFSESQTKYASIERDPLSDEELVVWHLEINKLDKKLTQHEKLISNLLNKKHDMDLGAALTFIRQAVDKIASIENIKD